MAFLGICHSWTDSQYQWPIFPKFLNLVFCFIIKNTMYFYALPFFQKSVLWVNVLTFYKLQQFQYFAVIFNWSHDAFVSAATADMCFMIHLVCLFMKTHLLALLQGNCLELVHCVFLRKLSACMRNITVFCQHLLWLIKLAILADTNISVKPKYRPIYRSISR